MMTPKEFYLAATSWGSFMHNGDPGACMYGFDEKGLVRNEEHRANCINYIETQCRKAADANIAAGDDPTEQHPELDAMLDYLRSAPVEGKDLGMDEFTQAYVTAALWSSTDESDESGGNPLDDNYGPEHIHPDTLECMKADCAKFLSVCGHLLMDENQRSDTKGSAVSQGGHDFWLTRNGHGCGFWDGDWNEPAASKLDETARSFGTFDLYIGDDGFVHGS